MPPDPVDPGEAALQAIRANPRDEQAWGDFYRYFRPQVAGALFVRGVRDELQDVIQETFLRFLRSCPWKEDWTSLPEPRAVTAYLIAIARSVIIDSHRKLNRRSKEDVGLDLDELPASTDDRPDSFVIAKDLLRVVENRLATELTPDDQGLLRLLLVGASLHEVAFEYGISYGAAGVRVHRLRQKLKKMIL